MELEFEELTHDNYGEALLIRRGDVPESFADNAAKLMELTDYGVEHGCIGHSFLIKAGGRAIGMILLGEAIPWETDPPAVRERPFYRLMGFVLDKEYRGMGLGGEALERAIELVYGEFGVRPIVLGCHRENKQAASFYLKHGFEKTDRMEGNDYYYLRFPERGH